MPLKTTGRHGWVAFQSGVRFSMRDENGKTLLVTVDADVLDFFEPEIADGDVQCFLRHRERIERLASRLYDGRQFEHDEITITYGDLRNL